MEEIKNMEEWCQRLIQAEGMVLKPYRCPAGKLTIGVGHCLDTNPLSPEEQRALGDYMHGITENGAKMLLRNDIKRAYEALPLIVKNFSDLSDDRQYALLDMCFQLGPRGLRHFKNMIRSIERDNFAMAAYECLASLYAVQTPQRAKRVALALKTGVWGRGLI